ncbi:MAG: starch-binding protein [Rhodospirillales bacterium]
MYIAYVWVDSWLKLMSACAEQVQSATAVLGGNGALGDEALRLQAGHDPALDQVRAAHADELGKLERRMIAYRDDLVRLQADHANELGALRARLEAGPAALQAEAERAEAASARAALEATIAGLQNELTAARAELAAARRDAASAGATAERARAESRTLRAGAAAAASAREKIEDLRRQLAAATAETAEARREIRKLTADRDALVRESESRAVDLDSLQAKLADALAAASPEPAAAEPVAAGAKPARKPRRSAVVTPAGPLPAATVVPVGVAPAVSGPVATLVREAPAVAVAEAPPAPLRAAAEPEAAAEPTALTVRFRKPAGWDEPLYVYYWATDPGVTEPSWPGLPMTDAGDGWWAHRIDGARAASLLFNDDSGHQTGDLYRDRSGGLDHDGGWVDDQP